MHDYKYLTLRQKARPAGRNIRWRWHGAIFFVLAAILMLFLVETEKSEASITAMLPVQQLPTPQKISSDSVVESDLSAEWEMESFDITLPPAAIVQRPENEPDTSNELEWQSFTVKTGYNFAIICSRAGVKAGEVHSLMRLGDKVSALKKLYPNDKILLKVMPDGSLEALQYDIHQSERLLVTRKKNPQPGQPLFNAEIITRSIELRTAYATAQINDSLYLAAQKAGLSNQITSELANLFGWDIDYAQQVRKGDHFTIVYDDYYRDGEKLNEYGAGHRDLPIGKRIIAAEFVNSGHVYQAIRYTDPDGKTDYYTPDGNSIRKAFMRNPVDARVSSHFNPKRRHPLLKITRPHRGVDYAAPTGTPIHAAGDGKVIFQGRQGGYGRTVIIQHGQRYSTLYAHMSKYAANTAKGRKVKQGQIIGYVGKSGLASGVHLHYEFRIDGVHRNPLTVKHPSVAPIPSELKADFYQKVRTQIAQLETISRISLASGNSSDNSSRI